MIVSRTVILVDDVEDDDTFEVELDGEGPWAAAAKVRSDAGDSTVTFYGLPISVRRVLLGLVDAIDDAMGRHAASDLAESDRLALEDDTQAEADARTGFGNGEGGF